MRLLLDMGLSVHAGLNAGDLINLTATVGEDLEGLLDFLLERGCSIDDPDSMGRTAFFLAAHSSDKEAVSVESLILPRSFHLGWWRLKIMRTCSLLILSLCSA